MPSRLWCWLVWSRLATEPRVGGRIPGLAKDLTKNLAKDLAEDLAKNLAEDLAKNLAEDLALNPAAAVSPPPPSFRRQAAARDRPLP